ncbi:MAG TPA: hypothetical protein VEP72_05850, partial [Microbacterium sp.]|nr:hypothetical protein [Microbacterium sp.]
VRLSRVQPALWQQLQRTGSLIAAADAVAAASRTGAAVAGLAGGMWQLPVSLRAAAERAGAVVRTGVAVRTVCLEPSQAPGASGATRATVVLDDGILEARAVVVATGSRAAALLLAPLDARVGDVGADRQLDEGGDTAPVRVVAALVRSEALDEHPVGSGVIVAPDVPSRAKALTHASAKWSWLGHDRGHVIRVSARDGAEGLDTPADLAREIALLTGIPPRATDIVATASAEYDDAVATPPVTEARRDELARLGIHLAGASVAGTGLASVVPHARALAEALLADLADAAPHVADASTDSTPRTTATTGSPA